MILLANCSPKVQQPQEVIVSKPEVVTPKIAIQTRPRPVSLADVHFDVVTEANLDQFIKDVIDREGKLVFIAVSVKDYENMSLNLAELRRFIRQQGEIIVFYENSLS